MARAHYGPLPAHNSYFIIIVPRQNFTVNEGGPLLDKLPLLGNITIFAICRRRKKAMGPTGASRVPRSLLYLSLVRNIGWLLEIFA
jgi:hypothetical protein